MGSQVIGEDQTQLPVRGTVGEVRREEEEPATKQRKRYTDLGEREEQVACHASTLALATTDEARREAEV